MSEADQGARWQLQMAPIAEALHDLCQPLTALQCRLEIGRMNEGIAAGGRDAAIWTECLHECERLNVAVTTMQALVREAQANR